MPENLVICFDGTSNQFSSNNTNIVRLVQAAKRDFDSQRVYYDPGVGTLPEPGWVTWLGKKIQDAAFREKVRRLSSVPEWLEYKP